MNKEQPPPEKSFTVAFEQMAELLRTEVKLKDRATKILTTSSLPSSFKNAVSQIAKMLRSQVRSAKPSKKRSWKKH